MQVGKCWTWELHAVPIHTVNKDPQCVLLVLGPAEQAADALQALAMVLQFLVLGFLGKTHHLLLFSLSMTWRA